MLIAGVQITATFATSPTFAEMLQKLHAEQYTGPVIIQFGQGVPSEVQIPCEPQRIRLDKPKRRT